MLKKKFKLAHETRVAWGTFWIADVGSRVQGEVRRGFKFKGVGTDLLIVVILD